VGAIRRDLAAVGIVGEQQNALLIYLVATSRKLSDPGAVVTRGRSGTGKTTLIQRVARLMPAGDVIDAMALTDASLFNGSADMLTHKLLVAGERKHAQDDRTRDANRMIRQLLSEKRLGRTVSVPCGKVWVTEHQVRPGPVAFLESTTARSVFAEDLNRLIQVYVDESAEQTRAVMVAAARRYHGPGGAADAEAAVIERHHAFQSWLRPLKVVIPYAEGLAGAMPADRPQCRRVIQQVLTVIEAVALLHQHHRQTDDGTVRAKFSDYAVARGLLAGPLHRAIGLGKRYARCKALEANLAGEFDTNHPAFARFAHHGTRDRLLDELCRRGVLRQTADGGSHRPARYRWLKGIDELVLPAAGALVQEFNRRGRPG
jgi:hypothetical protein